ncbi:hypothetical protein AVEN_234735-1 [Araneus ventricosus]|uniref:ATP-dependent DNA helicase n=1 Tax=Araneus ventricosus TaxID=182803 RepID=A0A4Y2S5M8_ARAVE|nr:hypothetical protein AVEN_234735-1 [Araneus ventricosus]
MMHKHGLEAVNRTLQDLRGNKDLMGGLNVVLAGDFRQTLPVIPRGSMADEIKACLKSSYLCKENIQWLQERTILTPLNEKVREINFTVQEKVPTAARTYYSIDKCLNDEEATSYPVEFLNSLNPSCIPLHILVLKVGCPIMLLRNLDPPKLCNGSRLIVKALHAHVIEVTILTGPFEGEHVLIPRIPLIPIDFPFSFQRLQFPLRLAFAITINKAQGQSLRVTGLDLTDECFSHGQLNVGMSRAKDTSTSFIIADEQKETKNIVYSQVLK